MKLYKDKNIEGYDITEVRASFSKSQRERFNQWFAGQTGGIIDGHFIIYTWDYERFMNGLDPFD
jgi:hypothetical protein